MRAFWPRLSMPVASSARDLLGWGNGNRPGLPPSVQNSSQHGYGDVWASTLPMSAVSLRRGSFHEAPRIALGLGRVARGGVVHDLELADSPRPTEEDVSVAARRKAVVAVAIHLPLNGSARSTTSAGSRGRRRGHGAGEHRADRVGVHHLQRQIQTGAGQRNRHRSIEENEVFVSFWHDPGGGMLGAFGQRRARRRRGESGPRRLHARYSSQLALP